MNDKPSLGAFLTPGDRERHRAALPAVLETLTGHGTKPALAENPVAPYEHLDTDNADDDEHVGVAWHGGDSVETASDVVSGVPGGIVDVGVADVAWRTSAADVGDEAGTDTSVGASV